MLLVAALVALAGHANVAVARPATEPLASASAASQAASPSHSAVRAAWRWPLRGEVVTPFHIATDPFAPGQHRGIDIAAPAGAAVRSACSGRARFAGRLPSRGGVVTVLCGPLVATYLELGAVRVRRGDAVEAGQTIGTVAASHLQLGARRAGDRHGYVDPLRLLRPDRPPPLGAAPRGGRRPSLRAAPPPPPVRAPSPRVVAPPGPSSPGPSPRVPLAAWLGLGLVAAGMPLGAAVRLRRARVGRGAAAVGRSA